MCWRSSTLLLFGALILLIACGPAFAQIEAISPEDGIALKAATHSLCKAQVAMVGESATHGDGHTLAFKVALVERLVDQCGFNAVFFEANQDEFIRLNQRLRSKDALTPDDLLTAVGGLWKFYREFQPLAPFLLTRAQRRRVVLGGLDDQLGQVGQNYANMGMVTELASLLPQPQRQGCETALHQRIFSDYTEAAPYSTADRSRIDQCLEAMQVASSVDTSADVLTKQERQEMISATLRWVNRDFTSDGASTSNRDRSMFQTFKWLQSRFPGKHKIIVWAATVHVAKQGDPNWGDHAGTNFGSFIHAEYGNHARSLGFSAEGGTFRQGKGKFPELPRAPADSVETLAFHGTSISAIHLGTKQLTAMGLRPGAFFYHSYQALAWSSYLDEVVVFRTEHPPADTR